MKLKIHSNPNIYFDTKTLEVNCIGVSCSRCPYRYLVGTDKSCVEVITKDAFKLLENNIKELIKLL